MLWLYPFFQVSLTLTNREATPLDLLTWTRAQVKANQLYLGTGVNLL